jgi:hypothetical protein
MSVAKMSFDSFTEQYDLFGDKWQDMGVDEVYIAGWNARDQDYQELRDKMEALVNAVDECVGPYEATHELNRVLLEAQELLEGTSDDT